jgi:stage II sporulation protein M
LWKPILLLVFLAAVGVSIAYYWSVENLQTYLNAYKPEQLEEIQNQLIRTDGFSGAAEQLTVSYLFLHNVQATLLIAFFGMFSFGVLGVMLYLINTSLVGGLMGLVKLMGHASLPLVVAGIVPHGIFEIPALLISCAAVLHLGLVLITPQAGRTIGEVLLEAIADWARVILGLVIPLLFIAAMVESQFTPHLLNCAVAAPDAPATWLMCAIDAIR